MHGAGPRPGRLHHSYPTGVAFEPSGGEQHLVGKVGSDRTARRVAGVVGHRLDGAAGVERAERVVGGRRPVASELAPPERESVAVAVGDHEPLDATQVVDATRPPQQLRQGDRPVQLGAPAGVEPVEEATEPAHR